MPNYMLITYGKVHRHYTVQAKNLDNLRKKIVNGETPLDRYNDIKATIFGVMVRQLYEDGRYKDMGYIGVMPIDRKYYYIWRGYDYKCKLHAVAKDGTISPWTVEKDERTLNWYIVSKGDAEKVIRWIENRH